MKQIDTCIRGFSGTLTYSVLRPLMEKMEAQQARHLLFFFCSINSFSEGE
jgi:hypothetical protein